MTKIHVNQKKKKNLIIGLIDHSGSMHSIKKDTEGGLRTFVEEQKKDTDDYEISMALAEFDTEYSLVYPPTPIADVPEYTLVPRGLTAFVDALGRTIHYAEDLVKKDNPDKVTFLIMTDGLENASKEYTLEQVKTLVEDHQKDGWEFIFLAANMDAVTVGNQYGFAAGASMTYGTNAVGVASTFDAASGYVRNVRLNDQAQFSEEDRAAAMGEDQG